MVGGFTPIPVATSTNGFTPIPASIPVSPTVASSDNSQNANLSQLSLDPNILDSFDSYTYNFVLKLYEAAVLTENRLPTSSDNFVVIAESGVTAAFNIKRVEISSIPGSTRENKGANATKFEMDIEEPLGFTLFDRLLQAAKDLGLQSLTDVPYVLELSFVGWDENGVPTKPIMATKMWVISVTNITPNFRKGGTEYHLVATPKNEIVQQDIKCIIPKTIKFKKEKNLQQTLDNFATELTHAADIASENTNYTPAGSKNDPTRIRHTYKFAIQNSDTQSGQLSSWTMADNTNSNTQRQFEMTPGAGESTQFEIVIQPGKDIFEVLTAILSNTNEAYKFLCPASDPAQAEFNNSEFTNFFHFDTSTVNNAYDPVTNAYSQTHTITIVPKVITRNNFLTTNPGDTAQVQQLMTDNLFIKGYEYLFTGENTSVLDVNLDFTPMWSDSIPLFTSLLAPHTSSNRAPNTMSVDTTLPYIPIPNNSQVVRNSNQTSPFALTANRPDQPPVTKYLEDYPAEGITIESFSKRTPSRDYSQYEKLIKGSSFAGDPASTAKLSIFGYLADQTFSSLSHGSSMLQINLIIRGDPFWFGINSEEINSLYDGADYTTIRKTRKEYAVYQSGEQSFYLKFRPAQAIDENTGLMKFNSSSIFNTLYTARFVVSTFENGSFKQNILGNIDRSFKAEAVQSVVDPLLDQQNGVS